MKHQTETHYETDAGRRVDVIRRSIPLLQSEAAEDLKPFFHLTSLFQDADEQGAGPLLRGNLTNIRISTETVDLSFMPFGAPLDLHRRLAPVRTNTLTIWRVQNVLDSLQASFSSSDAIVYLQTGGERLLSYLRELRPITKGGVEAVDLFNEPILAVRSWRRSKQ